MPAQHPKRALAPQLPNPPFPVLSLSQPASAAHHEFVALTGFFVVFRFFRLSPTAGMAALEQVGLPPRGAAGWQA